MATEPAPHEELLSHLEELSGKVYLKHVLPICCDGVRGEPEVYGTALLVSSNDKAFLVSAAHVFDPLKEEKGLYFYSERGTKRKLTGELLLSKPPENQQRKQDQLDIGVLRLDGDELPQFPSVEKFALPINALLPGALPRETKQYFVMGFPATKSKAHLIEKTFGLNPYGNLSGSIPDTDYQKHGLDPQTHIVMPFNKRSVLSKQGRGQFPNPNGMSGSPVWLVYDGAGPNDSSRNHVVGILIEYRAQDRILVATDIGLALSLICEASRN